MRFGLEEIKYVCHHLHEAHGVSVFYVNTRGQFEYESPAASIRQSPYYVPLQEQIREHAVNGGLKKIPVFFSINRLHFFRLGPERKQPPVKPLQYPLSMIASNAGNRLGRGYIIPWSYFILDIIDVKWLDEILFFNRQCIPSAHVMSSLLHLRFLFITQKMSAAQNETKLPRRRIIDHSNRNEVNANALFIMLSSAAGRSELR